MDNSFIDLGISPPILKALEDMGFQAPTEVQSRAIPHVLNKEDLIVKSKTGSGKTAVFGVSMLQLTDPLAPGPQGLILTPVRELAVQVDSDIKKMAKHLQHKTIAVYGQHNISAEVQSLQKGTSIVTGTPGRVFDHIRHGNLKTKNIRFLVLDEADRMLDMGFIDQVVKIIRTLPKDRVTLLFSATMPTEIRRICSEYMKQPVFIEIESPTQTVDTIEQVYYRVADNEKRTQLNRLLLVEQPESCMIFCNTRIAVDHVQSFLTRKGYASEALHGDIPQGKRTKTIQQFKQGEFHILVATDVAARGLHINNLSLVINYDVPVEKDSYVHRIGRTGRAGNVGRAVSLVTGNDIMSLYEIEEHIGALIPEAELPSEEFFNQRAAEAEKWLQDNALKSKPAKAAADPGSRDSKKKGSSQGKTRQAEKRREKPDEAGNKAPRAKPADKPVRPDRKVRKEPVGPKEPVRKEASGHTEHAERPRRPENMASREPGKAKSVRTTGNPNQTFNRSAHTAGRPAQPRTSAGADKGNANQVTEVHQDHVAPAGKSIMQRFLQRMFGRK